MILQIDEYLRQFELFKNIEDLIKGIQKDYPEISAKVPGLNQLFSKNMYNEWVTIAELIGGAENWDESDWDNFGTSMTMANMVKGTRQSIKYALSALGLVAEEVKFLAKGKETKGMPDTIIIQIREMEDLPFTSTIQGELSKCISSLLLTVDPTIDVTVDVLIVKGESVSSSEYFLNNEIGWRIELDSDVAGHLYSNLSFDNSNKQITIYSNSSPVVYVLKAEGVSNSAVFDDFECYFSYICRDNDGEVVNPAITVDFAHDEDYLFSIAPNRNWERNESFTVNIVFNTIYGQKLEYSVKVN